MNLDQQIRESISKIEIPLPVYDFSIGPVSIMVWKKFEFHLEICETEPYAPDGEVPLIMLKMGWIEFCFTARYCLS